MPLKPGTLLAVSEGALELTAEILLAEREDEAALITAVRGRLVEHQEEIMTEPALLDPDSINVCSVFLSRVELPSGLRRALESLGLSEANTRGTNEEHSIFSRLGRGRRAQLERWRLPYQRARDLSPRFAALEGAVMSEAPEGPLALHAEGLAELLAEAWAEHFRTRPTEDRAGLAALEETLLKERAIKPGRLVLQPALVRALAAFAGRAIQALAPESTWDDDDEDTPLHIRGPSGLTVVSDPVSRVTDLLIRGRQALLTDYAEAIVRQSLTRAART